MAPFSNLDDLYKHIESQLSKILKTTVAETVTDEMHDAIQDVVYDAYSPTQYDRREEDRGLLDKRNYQIEMKDDLTMVLTNETKGNSRYIDTYEQGNIDGIIVYGTGYNWSKSKIYKLQPFPRDFYGETVKRLRENRRAVAAMKKGLQQLGIQVV